MKLFASFFLAAVISLAAAEKPVELSIAPANPLLFGKHSTQRLVVTARYADGRIGDVTAGAQFSSGNESVATVNPAGVVRAEANGGARIEARFAGLQASTSALVQRAEAPTPLSFAGDVVPVVTKIGCNGGNCHGSLNGQNGFKLSLFGYEPDADYEMIVSKHHGRRLNLDEPAKSLLLRKPAFEEAHGGGKVLDAGSPEYGRLLAWISGGAKRDPRERRMMAVTVHPSEIVLFGKGVKLQLLVTARYSDGTEADVTGFVNFQSNNDAIVTVTKDGVITTAGPGESSVLVRGPGVVGVTKIGVVTQHYEVTEAPGDNFIDRHVFAKLKSLRIPPSPPADDATFLRRAYLDIVGLIPTAAEARAFLADTDPGKRAKLVDELLNRPEYADYWSLYWGDHLHNTKQLLYNAGPYTFTRWLYDAFRKNMPYNEFVRELLTSSGNMYDSPATSMYPLMKKELDMAATSSQLFLGVTIDCARCHNHPLERWTQDDYNGMAAFFSQVRYKGGAGPRNNERILYVDFDRQFEHPDTEKVNWPKPLGGPTVVPGEWTDRRELLYDWMVSPGNPFFSKAIVNRMWKQFMGRGIVEPIDDMRVTNPPTNEPLLEALAGDFVQHGYDLHHLIRQIASSRAYQFSSEPTEANREDTIAYSHYYPRRMIAESILDSIAQATGVPEQFESLYPGTRAMQLPEPEVASYFLDVFDRPSRQLICDRKQTNTLNQALHLVSGDTIHKKVTSENGTLAKLLAANRPPEEIVEALYLAAVSRLPDEEERATAKESITRSPSPKAGLEDLFWALLNSKEFLYKH